MNVFGESFPNEIISQINIRQKKYGSKQKNDDLNKFIYGNSAWIKLISSVRIIDKNQINTPSLRNISKSNGDELAKEYVLFNGTRPQNSKQRSGLSELTDNNNAYGVGGLEFGHRPMPGITQAEIKTLTRGSIKSSTVHIKCYNRTQFEIIDLLYLRLGFSVLLEWGHSLYFNKSGDLQENQTTLENEFLDGKLDYSNILQRIQEKRIKSQGNYDALYGIVKNFSWGFDNGVYNITLDLISLGDVLESLKMNKLIYDTNNPIGQGTVLKPNPINPLPQLSVALSPSKNIARHDIEDLFNSAKTSLDNVGSSNTMNYLRGWSDPNFQTVDFVSQFWIGHEPTYYIRLGTFINYISNMLVNVVKNGGKSSPIINFDYNTETNIIYTPPLFVSADPNICIFRKQLFNKEYNTIEKFGDVCEEFILEKYNGNTYSKLMNIYVNMDFIIGLMGSLEENHTIVSLIDFFNSMLKSICTATGNANDLHMIIDESTNTAIIVDETQLPDRDYILKKVKNTPQTKTAEFEIYSFNENGDTSNFVNNFSMRTEISSNLSTNIVLGSTARGYINGDDASAISKLNRGLGDRTKLNIEAPNTPNTNQDSLQTKYPNVVKNYNELIHNFGSNNDKPVPSWSEDQIKKFPGILANMMEYQQGMKSNKARLDSFSQPKETSVSPSTGFLPFNMSLNINGLSGMKVYHKFSIDSRFLPSNYSDSLIFYIKSITNTISNNRWSTEIESFSTPKITNGPDSGNNVTPVPNQTIKTVETDNEKSRLIDGRINKEVTPTSISNEFHPSVYYIFQSFLEHLLSEYKGYNIIINSIYRSFDKQAQYPPVKPGRSAHNYGYAIDLSLLNRKTNKLYNISTPKSEWLSTGIVDKANAYQLVWGGGYGKYDPVHFAINFNVDMTLNNIKNTYPTFNINDKATWKQVDYKKLIIVR